MEGILAKKEQIDKENEKEKEKEKVTEKVNEEETKKREGIEKKEIFILHNNYKETPFENQLRFQCELEFVQSLSDMYYLKFLFDNNYFEDPRFLNYLQYLNYWRTKPYIFFIQFPICLYVLEILNEGKTRESFKNAESFEVFLYYLKLHWLFFNWET